MKTYRVLFHCLLIVGPRVAVCPEQVLRKPLGRTFAIETYVARTYNYLDHMVGKDGLPYFNIFWTNPA
jgi:hypothetical protein